MGPMVIEANKPHAVCIPVPAQSHIKAMLKLAKLLHSRGFHITFVNTVFNHKRFLKSQGPNSLDGLPDFRFEAIPDCLPGTDEDATQDVSLVSYAISKTFLAPFCDLLKKLSDDANSVCNPPVTCIVSDGFMSPFTLTAAEEFGLPIALFYTFAACSFMGYKQFRAWSKADLHHSKINIFLVIRYKNDKKHFHLPCIYFEAGEIYDESYLTNGYLDTVIDWIPGMKGIRLRDLPTFFRTTDPNDVVFNTSMEVTDRVDKASAVVILTFDALEHEVLSAISWTLIPPVYTVGPIELLLNKIPQEQYSSMPVGYSLWKEETGYLEWLSSKPQSSVVYVNFGSIAVMTPEKLLEFGWGLANSKLPFFWVIRPDLVEGEATFLPPEFFAETKERGLIASWCGQEQVLSHWSIGAFLTHCGWNSTLESLTAGVPMLCWPFECDQQTNCYYTCNYWGVGMEIRNDVKREEVEKLVREMIEGEKGKKMREKALEWKKLAQEAAGPHGSSSTNFDNLVNQVLLRKS